MTRLGRVLVVLLAVMPAGLARAQVTVEPGVTIVAGAPRGVRVEVIPRPGEGWNELARRLTGSDESGPGLAGKPAQSLQAGRPVRVPIELLTAELQQRAVAALLPEDRCDDRTWQHRPSPRFAPDSSYESLAAWFATDVAAAGRIERSLRAGRRSDLLAIAIADVAPWLVAARGCAGSGDTPGDLLLAAPSPAADDDTGPVERAPFVAEGPRDLLPTSFASPPAVVADEAERVRLEYGQDAQGGYAVYRLQPGEAVYSSVIVRFSDRVHAKDVNEMVQIVASRSGVTSFSDLPVGFAVKVPVEFLAPEFLPPSDPRRQEYERRRVEVARFRNREVVRALDGVVVLLDPGHGGTDRGASHNGVWESDYVYDIVCRIKRQLQKRSRARVFVLTHNRSLGYDARDSGYLTNLTDTFVLTHPPYQLVETTKGVNLRWYLANSLYRQLRSEGVESDRIVFTSVHADSLHPSVRGAMVYVPGAEFTDGRHGRRDSDYRRYVEVREAPIVQHTARERTRSEGLSRQLAHHLLDSFAGRGLPVHEQKPIRGAVLRQRREWVPAVLRANIVPVRVLLEVCNIAHKDDSKLLASAAFREDVASAYVDALLRYYGSEDPKLAERR